MKDNSSPKVKKIAELEGCVKVKERIDLEDLRAFMDLDHSEPLLSDFLARELHKTLIRKHGESGITSERVIDAMVEFDIGYFRNKIVES